MAKQVTTLFIEDTAIRLLVARGKQAEKWASLPIEAGLVKHGLIQDNVLVADKIKELFRLTKITNKKVVIGLSEPGSLYRIVTLPKLPDAILPEAIKREAERVIPLSLDEVYLFHQIIATREQEMTLFMAAVSRSAVDNIIKTLQLAGLKPYLVDLVPLALCRIIEQPTAIIVSLRSSNFEIAIMVDQIPQVIRSLSLPGEAESLLEKLPTIIEELDRTITFYNSSHTDKPLDDNVPVFVDGDLVQIPNSWPSLVGNLGSKVSPLPSPMHSANEFDASQFTVNIGLVFKENTHEVNGSSINLNALPKSYLPDKPKASRILLPVAACVGILILAFIWLQTRNVATDTASINAQIATVNTHITQVNKDITAIKDQITQTQNSLKPIEDQVKNTQDSAATFTNLVDNMAETRNTANTNITQIFGLVPASLELTSVDLSNAASIQGDALNESSIFSYARALKDSKIYSSIVIQSITLNEQDVEGVTVRTYQFVIAGQ